MKRLLAVRPFWDNKFSAFAGRLFYMKESAYIWLRAGAKSVRANDEIMKKKKRNNDGK